MDRTCETGFNQLDVGASVTTKGALIHAGIVEVDVRVVGTDLDGLHFNSYFVDGSRFVEGPVAMAMV